MSRGLSRYQRRISRRCWCILVCETGEDRNLDFWAKLVDLVIGALAGAEGALALDRFRKRAQAQLSDRNPLRNISANHDLVRAVRIAWVEAALTVLDAAKAQARIREWSNQQEDILRFEKLARAGLVAVRSAAFDRRDYPGDSAIDADARRVIDGASESIGSADEANAARAVTERFSATLGVLAGWNAQEVPAIFGQIAAIGIATHGGGPPRSFGDLVFAAFAELIKSPDKYPEAREAFHMDMGSVARGLSKEILASLHGLDRKIDDAIARRDPLEVLRTGATQYLETLPEIAAGVTRIQVQLSSAEAAAERRQREAEAAAERRYRELRLEIAREKGVDAATLVPLFEHLGQINLTIDEMRVRAGEAIAEIIARSQRRVEASNDGADIDAAIGAARQKLAGFDTAGARAVLADKIAEEEAARRQRLVPLLRENAAIERLGYDYQSARVTLQQLVALAPDSVWDWIDLGDLFVT